MEMNTVLLSVKEYNGLRDFKENIKNGCSYRVSYSEYKMYDSFLTKEDSIISLLKINKELSAINSRLEEPNSLLSFKIKKMSFWQLFKYWIKGCKDI